jgi:hypothetical protein
MRRDSPVVDVHAGAICVCRRRLPRCLLGPCAFDSDVGRAARRARWDPGAPRRLSEPAPSCTGRLLKSVQLVQEIAVDPRENPYTPNAGARPPLFVGRDEQLDGFDVLLGQPVRAVQLARRTARRLVDRSICRRNAGTTGAFARGRRSSASRRAGQPPGLASSARPGPGRRDAPLRWS